MASLSAATREQFEEQGYLVVPGVLADADLEPVRCAIARTVDSMARDLLAEGRIADPHEAAPFDRRWALVYGQVGEEQPRRSWHNEVFDRAFFGLLAHPALADVAESLVGPEVSVDGGYWVRPKLPHEKRTTVLWHQDSNYLGPETADFRIVTFWIPLSDADERNGCMQVIPGSHRWGLQESVLDEEYKARRPVEDVEARGRAVSLPMKTGDVLCFTNLTYHRSLINQADTVRWSVDARYYPTGASADWFANYPGFVVRSRRDPASVGTWEGWREDHSRGKASAGVR